MESRSDTVSGRSQSGGVRPLPNKGDAPGEMLADTVDSTSFIRLFMYLHLVVVDWVNQWMAEVESGN